MASTQTRLFCVLMVSAAPILGTMGAQAAPLVPAPARIGPPNSIRLGAPPSRQGQAPARLGPSVGFGAGRTNTGYDGRGRGYRGGTAYVPFVPLGYGTYGAASTVVPQTTINQSVEANPVVVSIVNGGSGGSGPGVVPFRPICAGPKIISVAGARPASTGPLPRIVYGTQPDCIAADTTASAPPAVLSERA